MRKASFILNVFSFLIDSVFQELLRNKNSKVLPKRVFLLACYHAPDFIRSIVFTGIKRHRAYFFGRVKRDAYSSAALI